MQIKPQQCQHDKANFIFFPLGRGRDKGEEATQQYNQVLSGIEGYRIRCVNVHNAWQFTAKNDLPLSSASHNGFRIPLQPALSWFKTHAHVSHTNLTTGSKPAHICKSPKRTSHSKRSATRVQQLSMLPEQFPSCSPIPPSTVSFKRNGDSRDRRCTAILDPDAGLESHFLELRY